MMHLPMFTFKMGKKKKHQKCDEQIVSKIKMLKDQLRTSNGRIENTPSENDLFRSLLQLLDTNYCIAECPESSIKVKNDVGRLCLLSPQTSTLPGCSLCPPPAVNLLPTSPQRFALPLPTVDASTEPVQKDADEQELDDYILELLGDAPKTKSPSGPTVHKDIANRWQDILTKGLEKEVKEKLLKSYQVPSNCGLLLAPDLNPEVKPLLPDNVIKRDSTLIYKQNQLGLALSALAVATDMILTNEICTQKILKPISDACRILCDSHFSETKTRRKLILSSINPDLKDSLQRKKRGRLLFGGNMHNELKTPKCTPLPGDCIKYCQKPLIRSKVIPQSGINKASLLSMPHDLRRAYSPVQRATHRHSRCSLPPRMTLLRK